ncbi:hypothetical protein YC2023_099394 [Brassica napus]
MLISSYIYPNPPSFLPALVSRSSYVFTLSGLVLICIQTRRHKQTICLVRVVIPSHSANSSQLSRQSDFRQSLYSRPVQQSCPNPTTLVRIRPSLSENSALPGFSSSCPNILSFKKPNGLSNNPSVRPTDGALFGSKTDPFLALIGYIV